jgi:hypothetical protein
MDNAKNVDVPIHIVRFEDLIMDPQATLEKIFCFILGKESIEGMNIQSRIIEAVK